MMSIRLLPLIALTLALAGCGEEKQTAEQLRCGDSGTAFTMAKSLIQQRMSDRTIYFASREHTKIGKEPECIFRIGGSLWAGGDAGGYRDFNVTVQYRGKNYWAIDKLWIDRI